MCIILDVFSESTIMALEYYGKSHLEFLETARLLKIRVEHLENNVIENTI